MPDSADAGAGGARRSGSLRFTGANFENEKL
jgi:hypothetical protein